MTFQKNKSAFMFYFSSDAVGEMYIWNEGYSQT